MQCSIFADADAAAATDGFVLSQNTCFFFLMMNEWTGWDGTGRDVTEIGWGTGTGHGSAHNQLMAHYDDARTHTFSIIYITYYMHS